MKFLTTLLLVVAGVTASAQTYIDFRKPMRLLYGGDTLIISLQGDSVIFSGKAAELVLRDSTLLEIIQEHGGGGGIIYAKNGIYLDGDTLKLGGAITESTIIGNARARIGFENYSPSSDYAEVYLQSYNDGYSQNAFLNVITSALNNSTVEFGAASGVNSCHVRVDSEVMTVTEQIQVGQMAGPLTDNAPTASEINAIVSIMIPAILPGFQVTILDTNGTGLLYKCEWDGSSWYYTTMTKAL